MGERVTLSAGHVTRCEFLGEAGEGVDARFYRMSYPGLKTLDAATVGVIDFRYDAGGRLEQQAFFVGRSQLPNRVVSCSEYLVDRR